MSWKDKRIAAINRKSIKAGYTQDNPYFDEYVFLMDSKAKNKKEYKLERRNHEKVNTFNRLRKWL